MKEKIFYRKGNKISEVDPTNPIYNKYKILFWLWKKLPLKLTQRIGPWLREGLGI